MSPYIATFISGTLLVMVGVSYDAREELVAHVDPLLASETGVG